ncbi:integrin beta-7 [Crotalus adamanteus]|uniref:Integrin beta n=1 Tax=Crotalus adamanteus TaxID=8729 RepID=A0AAW1BZ69_CROAD
MTRFTKGWNVAMLSDGWTVSLGILLTLQGMTCGEKIAETGSCQPQPSCHECIQSHPSCAWCKQPDFVQAGESDAERCAPRPELEHRGCLPSEIMDPQGKQHILEDRPLKDNMYHENIIQLSPQRIVLQLRPGKEQSFTVRFKRAEGYPVDLYYLMDLSYSMKDDLEKIKQLGSDLMANLRKVTTSAKIGFGAFVDKTVLPYVNMVPSKRKHPCQNPKENCQSAFSFRHVLPLTENTSEFESRVSQQGISANLDYAEGGFDAIMQAAICKEQIGWRNVTSLLVFTSDGTYHTAGDGKLGGIYMPNDGLCHLDANGVYSKSHLYDYPSLGHLAEVLSKSNIQLIFAVTRTRLSLYKELSKLIPKSVVGELKSDSTNVVQLIEDAYKSLASTVKLGHFSDLPPGISIAYDSHCGDTETYGQTEGGECSDVSVHQLVQFTVKIMATTCLPESQKLMLRVLGVGEEVQVELSTVCECQCGDAQPDAHHCSGGHGNLTCGICRCHEGYVGRRCDCRKEELLSSETVSLASRPFCSCDNVACERHNGQLCAGNGQCQCGYCQCQANYTGSACECSLDTSGCTQEGKICNGHGHCVCNRCQCDTGWLGVHCADLQMTCEAHRDCAECKAFGTGPLSQNCSNSCSQTVRVLVAPVDKRWCQMKGGDGRLLIYLIEKDKTGGILLTVNDEKVPDRTRWPNLMPVLRSALTVVSIGVLLIALSRGIVEICDRREFRRREKEQKSAKGSQVNNFRFRSATTVINPQDNGYENIANKT